MLIGIGLMVMCFSFLSMYKVFVDRQPVAPVIQMTDMNLRSQFGNMQIPMDNINSLANIGLFAVFMLFVLALGGKLAALGCNLLKIERIHEALRKNQGNPPALEKELKKV